MRQRPVSTYSIVAADESGSLGVAVQSHWFGVGSVVPHVERGVGAVAIQSVPDPAHGPQALELLRSGASAEGVLAELLRNDDEDAMRQIAIVDVAGTTATFTGPSCIPEAGHTAGDKYSAQANIMERNTVWSAMGAAFEATSGDLATRMLAALAAAEAEGGDLRGKQSAALVVSAPDGPEPATGPLLFDLRVEDHPDPIGELSRLVELRRVYIALADGDEALSKGDIAAALASYRDGAGMAVDEATGGEAAFWTGLLLATQGSFDEGAAYLRRAQDHWTGWSVLVPRLVASGIVPDDDLARRLVAEMSQ